MSPFKIVASIISSIVSEMSRGFSKYTYNFNCVDVILTAVQLLSTEYELFSKKFSYN